MYSGVIVSVIPESIALNAILSPLITSLNQNGIISLALSPTGAILT